MNIIQKHFRHFEIIFNKEMKNLSAYGDFEEGDINLIRSTLNHFLEYEDLAILAHNLNNFYKIMKFDEKLYDEASKFRECSAKLRDEKQSELLLVQDFVQNTINMKQELSKNGLGEISKECLINRIIAKLSVSKHLMEFLNSISSENDFREVKELLSDYDETYVKRKNIEELEIVWTFKQKAVEGTSDLKTFINKCEEIIKNESFKNIPDLIDNCVINVRILEKTMKELKQNEVLFQLRILEILKKSVFKIKDVNSQKIVTIIYEDERKNSNLEDLQEFKQKALLTMNSEQKKDEHSIIIPEQLLQFVKFTDEIERIIDSYKELASLGFFQKFFDEDTSEKTFQIPDDLELVADYKKKVENYNQEWKTHINILYSSSYYMSHFEGKQLKALHNIIFEDQENSSQISNFSLWINNDMELFIKAIKDHFPFERMEESTKKSPLKQASLICDFLNSLDPEKGIIEEVQQKHKVKLISVSTESLYQSIASSIDTKQMHDLRLSQILFCSFDTNPQEILCFLNRAFLNKINLPFILIGCEYLSAKLQNFFCEQLDNLLKTFKTTLNMILIGSSMTERIYNYFYHHDQFAKEVTTNIECGKACYDSFSEMVDRFMIVHSTSAGAGKSSFIARQCKFENLKPIFFPIAGNITRERIAERLSSLKFEENTALVLQLHNVVEKKILDEILFQLVFFRGLKSESFLFFPQWKFSLFIEIQNLLEEDYLKSLRTLALFVTTDKVKSMGQPNPQEIAIDPKDELKFYFVVHYLKAFKEGKLVSDDISHITFKTEFEKNPSGRRIELKTCQDLFKEYFFTPLHYQNPSYTQLSYFIEILFSSLKTFADSPYLSLDTIKDTFKNVSSNLSNQLIKLLRPDFVQILIENAREFIVRTVSPESYYNNSEEEKVKNFMNQLDNFPLLIMKQGEKEDDFCYSFIYNDIKKVPKPLKIFILMQNTKGGVNIEKLKLWLQNEAELDKHFASENLMKKNSEELLEMLRIISGVKTIKRDPKYALTLDNFYKMCLIIQRIRSNVPIVIMGETGVGKTALIRFLAENVYGDRFEVINVHAGVNEKTLIEKVRTIQKDVESLPNDQRIIVFFDEFNTSQELGLISQILLDRRFLDEKINEKLVFLAACNPYRKREQKQVIQRAGIKKSKKIENDELLYKVYRPPLSLIEVTWNYQELKEAEIKKYIQAMLSQIEYRLDDVVNVLIMTHKYLQEQLERSSVSLRDVSRFRTLYCWFLEKMPFEASLTTSRVNHTLNNNYEIAKQERAFILAVCLSYYIHLPTMCSKNNYIHQVEATMSYKKGYIMKIFENEQIDWISRMDLPEGTALNLSLRENLFTAFVCVMNKIPLIIVGMPGCSKSLAVRLLFANLRGQGSSEDFFRKFDELYMINFQGSESCTSEGVEKVFERAKKNLGTKGLLPVILFDEIGLAEISEYNPLKVLHSNLEVDRSEVSFVGISNWELDGAKMNRFLVLARPEPDELDLTDTATKIFQSILGNDKVERFKRLINVLSCTYLQFINIWKKDTNSNSEFFGLRDFYSLIKFVYSNIKSYDILPQDQQKISDILKRGIIRNFNGHPQSIKLFIEETLKGFCDLDTEAKDFDVLSLLQENLEDSNSRSLLVIVKGDAPIHITLRRLEHKKMVTIYGSPFEQDRNNQDYNLKVLREVINYAQEGYTVAFINVNDSIQTSLYDLHNKSYHKIGNKSYCRIAIGEHSNPRCLVHSEFRSIVYFDEKNLDKVDAPFLNRFEKYYLTLDNLLSSEDCAVRAKVQAWITKITSQYFKDSAPLSLENFIINSSEERVASLSKKVLDSFKEKGITVNIIDEAVRIVKEELVQNATSDLILWIETSGLESEDKEEFDFIKKSYEDKIYLSFEQLTKKFGSKVVIFTHDPSASYLKPASDRVKVFKMVEMKCEKDLRLEIQNYFETDKDLCIIQIDCDTEIKYLPSLSFLIDNALKAHDAKIPKNFILVLSSSRVAAANCKDSSSKQISKLDGWIQIFLEILPNGRNSQPIPSTPMRFINDERINLKETIANSFLSVIKRFDFRLMNNFDEAQNLSSFMKYMLKIANDELLIDVLQMEVTKNLENFFGTWKTDILNHKLIASLAINLFEAIKLYITEKIEDLLVIILERFFVQEIFSSLFPSFSLEILEGSVPGIAKYLEEKCSSSQAKLHFESWKEIFHQYFSVKMIKLPKAANSIGIFLDSPRLYIYTKEDEKFIFGKDNDEEGSFDTLSSIALQIYEIEQAFVNKELSVEESKEEGRQGVDEIETDENINDLNEEHQLEYESLIKKFDETLLNKSILSKSKSKVSLLTPEKAHMRQMEREFYLTDIRHTFLRKIVQTDLKASLFLDQLILLFLDPEYSVRDYLMTLLKGQGLWNKLLHIYDTLYSKTKYPEFPKKLLLPNIQLTRGKEMGNLVKDQITYIKSFLKLCENLLSPKEDNIEALGGSEIYFARFTSIYVWTMKILQEFKRFELQIPEMLRIWRNFVELIEKIDSKNSQKIYEQLNEKIHFDSKFDSQIFPKLDDFLEDYKKLQNSKTKAEISNLQASIFRFWTFHLEDSPRDFTERLFRYINTDEHFPNYSSALIMLIMPDFDDTSDINNILEELKDPKDVLAEFKKTLKDPKTKNYQNNLSVIITDYFNKIITDPEVENLENTTESMESLYLSHSLEKFENCVKKIEKDELNDLQVLAALGFLRHYLQYFVNCFQKSIKENVNYQILAKIDKVLSKSESKLADDLCRFVLKLLRDQQVCLASLNKLLFSVQRAEWLLKFKEDFKNTKERIISLPCSPQSKDIEERWKEFELSSFENEQLFEDIIKIAGASYNSKYQFLNFLMEEFYIGSSKTEKLLSLKLKKAEIFKQSFNKYQLDLINFYLSQKNDDQFFLYKHPDITLEELHYQLLILNLVNWLICLEKFKSPWTSLFFENGEVPEDFGNYFNNQFVITGLENPFITNAMMILEEFRFKGIYKCSNECDYIYTILNCGWPNASSLCPYCMENIGSDERKGPGILAREDKGAKRLGPLVNRVQYCYDRKFQENKQYWDSLKKSIENEIDGMKQKKTIKRGKDSIIMTGYTIEMNNRVNKKTFYFLRFILHASLYVFSALKWIKPEEALRVIKADSFQDLINYLKDNTFKDIEMLQKNLNCSNPIEAIFDLEQRLPNLIQEISKNVDNQSFLQSSKDRDNFEAQVQDLLKSLENIQKAPESNEPKSQLKSFDSILCEKYLPEEYKFLRVLRMVTIPSLEVMQNENEDHIQRNYPLIWMCMKNLSEIEKISKLIPIVQFSNQIMRLSNHKISREQASKTKISDFINDQPEKTRQMLNENLQKFFESWNSLSLGTIYFRCSVLGTTAKYNIETPVIAFIVDSMNSKNDYGKILAGVINTLSEKQNELLQKIASRVKEIPSLQNIQLFSENNACLPQMAHEEDILSITEDYIQGIITDSSSSHVAYGYGKTTVYDFERIQFNLLCKLIGKKLFITNLDFYQNVQFVGEPFSRTSKFSDYISSLRDLGLNEKIPDGGDQLEKKMKEIENRAPNQFYSVLEQLRGSLEKIMIFYKNIVDPNVTLSEYVTKYHFSAISSLIVKEVPIKNYNMNCLVSLYEWTESKMMSKTWELIPKSYKQKKLEEEEKKALRVCLKKLTEPPENRIFPELSEFMTAFARFASRCLLFEDLSPDTSLNEWLLRLDFWSYPYKEECIENLSRELPTIMLSKAYSFHELIESMMNSNIETPKVKSQSQEKKKTKLDKNRLQS